MGDAHHCAIRGFSAEPHFHRFRDLSAIARDGNVTRIDSRALLRPVTDGHPDAREQDHRRLAPGPHQPSLLELAPQSCGRTFSTVPTRSPAFDLMVMACKPPVERVADVATDTYRLAVDGLARPPRSAVVAVLARNALAGYLTTLAAEP